ncbi:L-rhamnose mutarotase [Bacillus swezeyi]|uniref:L-rhamnose mutarotase n=1 Tax=Bacillus swezeyi TaxID=1925020 RepID=A0A1R1RM40_9BACI|nr:L-rhamnose mutarotase [Bacillus swezeyi]MEC1262967.1 L-rhamnose mutarotase [Bacillus swezeyi]MED2930002.1 L-rhamnose mutarotase [Bacillus swezeyi]MED2944936.1 L-rhamnose mutarotase [Bacillus swezeyi]MED2963107.1 L-rhamnose mutarotase [Bacillus swezeyi]MED2976186.1 L-rhamnose mutarotase [Bacillus swezeyi]
MLRKAFMMKVYPGQQQEYGKEASGNRAGEGPKTSELYWLIEIKDEQLWSEMAETEINQKWWEYMSPVMETHPDHSPVSFDLQEVFHLK